MYNPSMIRWCSQSIYKHFRGLYDAITPTPSWPMYFEGDYRILRSENEQNQEMVDKVEIRFDGPHDREMSKGTWLFQIKINALVSVKVTDNLYARENIIGLVRPMFVNSIPIYNGDTQELIDCLQLQAKGSLSGKTGMIKISNFGQVQSRLPLLQSTIDANYAMVFKE